MSDIKLVAPFKASNNHHQRVLSLLKQKPISFSGPLPVLQVPVRSNIDVSDILAKNARRLGETNKNTQECSGNVQDLSGSAENTVEEVTSGGNPASFIELGTFQPQNRLEQISTVFFQDFPALRPQYVERVLMLMADSCPLKIARHFCFSVIAESINDTRGVFVRFPTVKTTQWAKKATPVLFPHIIAVFDENLDSLAATETPVDVEAQALKGVSQNIASIFNNKKLFSQSSRKTGTEDLDEVMQYYSTYKVENSELVEVPKELKEVIVRDIIKFRAKVLTIEREARKKEIEKERRKAKARLTSIFEGIRSTTTSDQPNTDDIEIEDSKETIENPLDLLSDEEFQAYIEAEQKKALEAQYEQKYRQMALREKKEKTVLLDRLDVARGYELALVENKIVHMEEFKVGIDELSSNNPPAALNEKLKLYYTNHGEYLRHRNQERNKEEQIDEVYRADEAKFIVEKAPSSSDLTPKISIEETSAENKPVTVAKETATVIVSSLSKSDLKLVKDHIGNLVEEFLGIKEDVLADFIYDFVFENNLDRVGDLVAELQETLDEDSQILVDQLHSFIASLKEV